MISRIGQSASAPRPGGPGPPEKEGHVEHLAVGAVPVKGLPCSRNSSPWSLPKAISVSSARPEMLETLDQAADLHVHGPDRGVVPGLLSGNVGLLVDAGLLQLLGVGQSLPLEEVRLDELLGPLHVLPGAARTPPGSSRGTRRAGRARRGCGVKDVEEGEVRDVPVDLDPLEQAVHVGAGGLGPAVVQVREEELSCRTSTPWCRLVRRPVKGTDEVAKVAYPAER